MDQLGMMQSKGEKEYAGTSRGGDGSSNAS